MHTKGARSHGAPRVTGILDASLPREITKRRLDVGPTREMCMSRQFRLKATGAVLAALFVVGPMLANGTAQAELTRRGNDLVFGGGGRNMLGLSCAAEPRSDSMTVPAGSTVRVVNDTGHDADLRLNGVSKGELRNRSSTEVLFRRGPVEVTLKPDCPLGGPSEPATVTVTPSPSGSGTPTPSPTSASPSASPGGSPSKSAKPAARPGRPAQPRPPRTATTPNRRPTPADARTTAATAGRTGPQGTTTTRATTRTNTVPGTATTGATTAVTEMPVGGTDVPVSTGPVLAAPDIDATSADSTSAAAEPVAALEPLSQDSPFGLLALAATVCLAGVTAAAIRAITAQRASRSTMA
jgi:hypothetical protein